MDSVLKQNNTDLKEYLNLQLSKIVEKIITNDDIKRYVDFREIIVLFLSDDNNGFKKALKDKTTKTKIFQIVADYNESLKILPSESKNIQDLLNKNFLIDYDELIESTINKLNDYDLDFSNNPSLVKEIAEVAVILNVCKICDILNTSFKHYNIFNIAEHLEDYLNRLNKKMQRVNAPNQNTISPIQIIANNNDNSYISRYTINISQKCAEGKVSKTIGRDDEIKLAFQTMSKYSQNNLILVGESGCGKTQIVYGIAQQILNNESPSRFKDMEIVMLDQLAIISNTQLRGMFEERMQGLTLNLKASKKYILFIDDIHNVLKNGSKDTDNDISKLLSNLLNDGEIIVIGTTTFKGYHNSIETNPILKRKFQKIIIEPTNDEITYDILNEIKGKYERYHNVKYSDDILRTIIKVSKQYLTDKSFPYSAIDLMDVCGANNCFNDKKELALKPFLTEIEKLEKQDKYNAEKNGDVVKLDEVNKKISKNKTEISVLKRDFVNNADKYVTSINENSVLDTISNITKIPLAKLSVSEKEKILNLDSILKQTVIGQDEAIDIVCRTIKRNKSGIGSKKRVIASILCLGPTGCGKTLLAKTIAKEVFGDEKAIVRLDMSEYSEEHSVSKLIGSSPGYIGFENGGQLTEAVKNKPSCVLLLDEIEKANKKIFNIFLQLFDEGRLTDNSGNVIDFKNVIVIMTSNIGAKEANDKHQLGFINNVSQEKKSIVEKQLKNTFNPEFINRIDNIISFNHLSTENYKGIINLELKKLAKRCEEISYAIEWDDDVVDFILSKMKGQEEYGARPIIRIIQDNIEDLLADIVLKGNEDETHNLRLTYEKDNGIIVCEKNE